MYANNCKRTWSFANIRFRTNILTWIYCAPLWENIEAKIFSTCICFTSNRLFVCKFVKTFWSKSKQMIHINGICEYTEACEYKVNKINICFDSLGSEYKKLWIWCTLVKSKKNWDFCTEIRQALWLKIFGKVRGGLWILLLCGFSLWTFGQGWASFKFDNDVTR